MPFPHSVLTDTGASGARPAFRGPCWIKRGDVHATQEGDVAFADAPEVLSARLASLAERGIAKAVVQDHAPGDLIKFYGVSGLTDDDPSGKPSWFQWFYHRDQVLSRYAFDTDALAAAAARAAAALGLDVYGGDAIVSPRGGDLRDRPERLAELRPLPRGRGLAHRGAAGGAVQPERRPPVSDDKRREVGPRSREIVALEQRHMAPGLQSFALYAGLAMAEGRGSHIFDEDGNSYIDFIAGIAIGGVGHCHPHYVQALQRQAERLTFGSFTTEIRAKFLNLLGSVTPPGLTRIQLFSGGAEAVEAAFRLAKSVTKKFEFVGYSGAFHGKTGGVLPLLWGDFKDGLGPFVPGTYVAPYAYCYRCPLNLKYPDCGIACAEETRAVIRNQTGGQIAAVIVEPMQGTAGNVIPPPGFLPAIRAIAQEHGALFIADEMITGFGRTGKFWGVEPTRWFPTS